MGDSEWIITMTVVGTALELGGLALLFVEIRRDAEALKDFSRRDATARPGTIRAITQMPSATVSDGSTPTKEERLDKHERALESLRDDLANLKRAQPHEWRRDIDDAITRFDASFRDYQRALERFITGNNTRPRVLGVALVAAGLLCATMASILSTARSG